MASWADSYCERVSELIHSFAEIKQAEQAIIRPEFVKVTKKDEVQKYKSSVSDGVIEYVSFRGNYMKLAVRVNNVILHAKRGLKKRTIAVGEHVDVF